jgi:hypothetical protein
MALASARRFVEEGTYVFSTSRMQKQIDEAVKLIGRNVTGVRGDAANLDDLGRCSIRSSGKRVRSTFCSQAPVWAKPSSWARLPSSTSIQPSA